MNHIYKFIPRKSPRFISLITVLSASLLIPLSPTHANPNGAAWSESTRQYSEGWPWPSAPDWWNQPNTFDPEKRSSRSWLADQTWWYMGGEVLRLGQWLPCRPEWSMNDCIKEINVYDKSNTKLGKLLFVAGSGFDPFEIKQVWQKVEKLDYQSGLAPGLFTHTPGLIDDRAIFDPSHPTWRGNWWKLPTGVRNSDGTDLVDVSVSRDAIGVQIDIKPQGVEKNVSLSTDLTFEVVLQSKNLKGFVRWYISNTPKPTANFANNGTITVRATPSLTPIPGPQGCEALFGGNQEKAASTAAFISVNLSTLFGRVLAPGLASGPDSGFEPGEVVMSTNGWSCFKGIEWDREAKQIVVYVGAPHFHADGTTEVDGWVDLRIAASFVRAWWNRRPDQAVNFARVEVIYKDGVSKTASVSAKYTLSETKNKEWVDLRAYGFTYSKPSLRFSMATPGETSTPVITTQPTAKPATAKKITCVKGKTIKKVSTKSCPKGFKKR